MPTFRPMEIAILTVLSDGLPHNYPELKEAMGDTLTTNKCLGVHISYIRKKIQPQGLDILCVKRYGKYHYQQVRLIVPDDD